MGFKSIWRSITMGANQGTLTKVPSVAKDEPLECVIKEHKRDEHLKNLGMKRNKSIRKSIAKKLRKRDKKDEQDGVATATGTGDNKENVEHRRELPAPQPLAPRPVQVETRTSIGSRVEGGTKVEVIQVEERKEKELVGDTQPLPGSVEYDVPRKMEKLRRSIRHSMRKRKESGVELTRAQKWQVDEAAVRSATCQFYVKYLGAVEVFESRGMQVCEAAVNRLKTERRRTIRGTLHVSGDSVRLVDDDTKGLVLDQTIEKVSFCAPDRNFERGFSYICRDGTCRRWMCHAFLAVSDTGERLSHAVGCAFGICLENKQKRDKKDVTLQYDSTESSFTRNGSFRVGTMTERLNDPQAMKLSPDTPKAGDVELTMSVERPRAPDSMYQRQASFRGLGQISGNTPFKRHARGHLSLRLNDLPSNKERRGGGLLSDSPIMEDIELPASNLETVSSGTRSIDLLTSDDPFTVSELTTAASGTSGASTPALHGDNSSTYSMSPPPSLLIPTKLHKLPETPESEHNPWDNVPDQPTSPPPKLPTSLPPSKPVDPLASINIFGTPTSLPVNPVPSLHSLQSLNNQDLTSSTWTKESMTLGKSLPPFLSSAPFPAPSSKDTESKNGTSSGYNSPSSSNSGSSIQHDVWQSNGIINNGIRLNGLNSNLLDNEVQSAHLSSNGLLDNNEFKPNGLLDNGTLDNHGSLLETSIQTSILEDPFDAEWAAIATRNYANHGEKQATKNPFLQDVKAFEFHL